VSGTNLQPEISVLKQGGIIAYPSEGVWGVGCDPFNEDAVKGVLQLKNRGPDKGLILVGSRLQQIQPLLETLTPKLREILEQSCPGPDTWLIPDPDQVIPRLIKGKFDTVAIRISKHPIVKRLCDDFAGLIVSTSANPEGLPPAQSAAEVLKYFPAGMKKNIDCVVPGELGSLSGPSKIIDLISRRELRG
jgi:L-threonylcarbamoyladenylate synthase